MDVDVSGIDIEINYFNLNKELFTTKDLKATNKEMYEKYGDIYEIYISNCLKMGSATQMGVEDRLRAFVSNADMQLVAQDIEKIFGDLSQVKKRINEAFKHLKYYYNEGKIPKNILFYNSTFEYGVISYKENIGIGLEMYLGSNSEVIKRLPPIEFPEYQKEKMTEEYMVVDVMRSWFEYHYMDEEVPEDFMGNLIHYGKIMYMLDAIIPNEKDYVKIRYSRDQLEWVEGNENNIWKVIVDSEILFTTDIKVIRNYFGEGPFTPGLPEGAPPRAGMFIGWKMVRDFMEENPDMKLPELMAIKPNEYRKIYRSYNPEK
ncbi:MAG: hypothetical protein R2799_06305 [Crocinitomicaceae bacterium]